MAHKVKNSLKRLEQGNFHLPSPDEIDTACAPTGSFTAAQLAEWGVAWPPKRGWRRELEKRWYIENIPQSAD